MNHIQISLILVKSCDDNSGIWCVIKRCKSESIWPRNIVIFPFGNCNQQVIGLLKRVLDSLTSWQHQWRFFRSLRPWRFLWSYSLKPIRFHPMPLRPRNGLHDLGETLPEMSRGVLGDSTKSLSSMWWNTLFDVVGLCNYSPFVARLVCRNQNGVSHDTRKQWKQHGPVQGQMWKSSAAQDSLYIYNWLLFPIPKKISSLFPGWVPTPIPVPDRYLPAEVVDVHSSRVAVRRSVPALRPCPWGCLSAGKDLKTSIILPVS